MEERKRKTMKINAIGVTTFGNKQQFVKKAAAGPFVKGLSKPDKAVEDEVIKGNDEGWNPCDSICCGDDCDC